MWGGEQFARRMREMEDAVWEDYSSKVAKAAKLNKETKKKKKKKK